MGYCFKGGCFVPCNDENGGPRNNGRKRVLSSNEIASAHEFGYYSVIVNAPRNDATVGACNDGYNSVISSSRSFQAGFILFIRASFFFLLPGFICFSLSMASMIVGKTSYQTILSTLYFAVKLFGKNLVLCSMILPYKSEVTPVYKTVLFLFVRM